MASIQFKKVTKKYGQSVVIGGLDLEVRDKEFMVLVGPSGCGKSTLLRMIAGLEEIDGGELEIDGKVVNDLPPKDRDIAIVFQNYALYPHMTAYENLAFGLKIRGVAKEDIKKKVTEVATVLEIENLLDRKPKDMSGGQRQRVAIGRAIVREPKVFLFDEPLSNLDAKLRTQMRMEIAELHKKLKTTIVYVTHDQVEAMTLGDRIAVLDKGEIKQIGSPEELYRRPANKFVAGFIGSPAMNFIDGRIKKSETKYVFSSGGYEIEVGNEISVEEGLYTLGVRPEHINISSGSNEAGRGLMGTVHHIERTGYESFLFLECGNIKLTMRGKEGEKIQEDQDVEVAFDWNKVHWFQNI